MENEDLKEKDLKDQNTPKDVKISESLLDI